MSEARQYDNLIDLLKKKKEIEYIDKFRKLNENENASELIDVIIKFIGIDNEYSGKTTHNNSIELELQKLKNQVISYEGLSIYMNKRLKQAVPAYAFGFILVNMCLFCTGITILAFYLFKGIRVINPVTLFVFCLGFLGLSITGFISINEWRDKNEFEANERNTKDNKLH